MLARNTVMRLAGIVILLCCGAPTAVAQDAGQGGSDAAAGDGGSTVSPWSGRFGIGGAYDSNVALLEVDERSGADDFLAELELGLGYDWNAADERTRVTAGYDLSQSLYAELSDFNLRLHRLSLDASHDTDVATVGVLGNYVHASVDDSGFLVFRQVSPYVSRLFGERLFLRASYAYTDKDFADNPERDADAHAYAGDAFVFLDGLRTYLVFGYRRDREIAAADRFSYAGNRYSVQLVRRLDVAERQLVTRLRTRFEDRRYDATDPEIGERRRDERWSLEGMVEIPTGERTTVKASWEYADNRSNLPALDFSRHLVSLMLDVAF